MIIIMIYGVKSSIKSLCHSHGDETLIIKKFFLYKLSLPPNTTSSNGNVLEWILWKKEMIGVGQTLPSR